MERIKKTLLHMLFVAALIAAVAGFSGIAEQAYAAADDMSDGVYYTEPYAEECKPLTVTYDGDETDLEYKWYMDGKLLEFNTDKELTITADHYESTIRTEVWSGTAKLGEASMFCSKLPVVYIDTEGGADIVSKDDYLDAQMHLQGSEKYNTENTTLYTGATEIKGRGNSTWTMFPKKPYKLKLDKKTDLFGLGKNKHWVLLANYIDESNMRNMLAGEIATRMNVGAMDGTWVEVVLNGENLGTYMLCEHVRLSEDRVNVFDWESAAEDIAEAIAEKNGLSDDDMDDLTDQMAEEDMSWISTGQVTFKGNTYRTADYYDDLPESFSGGYLLEMDFGYDEISKFTTVNGAPLMFKSPEFICTDEIAMNTVQNYVQLFEDALYSKDFCTETEERMISYTELCDTESMASFWLASEILMNEIGSKSTYFQKDIDQPLVFGPVWDFDYSSGSVAPFNIAQDTANWTSDDKYWEDTAEKWWFNQAMRDPYFAVKARDVFIGQEAYLKDVIAEDGLLNEWYEYLHEAGEYNYELWQYSRGFEEDYQTLISWLTERINWMDRQFATYASTMKSMGIVFSDKFDLELQSEDVTQNSTGAYVAEAGKQSYNLSVKVSEGRFPELNYYVNSKYAGTAALTDGAVTIVIKEELLTEPVGSDNVISVWLKDQDGNLVEQQYLIVKLISDKQLCNVVFNDMGGTHAVKVISGEKIYIGEPQQQEASMAFEGWSDGTNVYDAGEWLNINNDVTFNALWATCSDGTYVHEFKENGDLLECVKEGCEKSKTTVQDYVNIAACAIITDNENKNYYTGKEIIPEIALRHGDNLLVENKHYTIEFSKNIEAGYAMYVVKSIKGAGYKGEYELSYRILPQKISKTSIKVPAKYVLGNGAAEPAVEITYNGMTLVNGTDYNLSYSNNTALGTATVTITGTGNYTGSVTKKFNVVGPPKTISKCTFTAIGTKDYTGKAVKPALTIKDGSKKLTAGTHYTVQYTNNTKCGTATVKITGVEDNGYKGSKSLTFKIRPAKPTVKVTNEKYNQQKVTWAKVTGATKYNVYKSTDNKNFKFVKSVKSSSARVYNSKSLKTGKTYYYQVKAIRAQKSGSKTTNYLSPVSNTASKKTVLYRVTVKSGKNTSSKAATLKWVGVNGASGYKIYRSTTNKSGSFKLIKNAKRTVRTYKDAKLKKGKTYYYKVRAYRIEDGKTVYGNYSKVKAVKIKK